eukprot:1801323-Rhodomonas_salina.2
MSAGAAKLSSCSRTPVQVDRRACMSVAASACVVPVLNALLASMSHLFEYEAQHTWKQCACHTQQAWQAGPHQMEPKTLKRHKATAISALRA